MLVWHMKPYYALRVVQNSCAGESGALGDFQRVVIIRAMKPDRVPSALQIYCEKLMGSKFVNQDAFKADVLVKVCDCPMGFVGMLQSGSA